MNTTLIQLQTLCGCSKVIAWPEPFPEFINIPLGPPKAYWSVKVQDISRIVPEQQIRKFVRINLGEYLSDNVKAIYVESH